MARFLSKFARYEVAVLPPEIKLVQGVRGPEETTVRDKVSANFEPGGLTEYEVRHVEEWMPEMRRGMPSQEASIVMSGGQAVATEGVHNVLYRVGRYDTDERAALYGWDAETKAAVEANLRKKDGYGVDFIESVPPAQQAPWPNYNRFSSVEKILERVVEDGYDPNHVLAFEQENKNRQEIVAALQNYLAAQAVDEESEVLA